MTNLTPNIIYVYAVDTVKTTKEHVTSHGWGHSTPLETPVRSTTYVWEGLLHGSRPDIVSSSNFSSDLGQLAENLAVNVKASLPLLHKIARVSAYELNYSIGPRFKGNPEDTPRILKPEQQQFFDEAFKRSVLWGI